MAHWCILPFFVVLFLFVLVECDELQESSKMGKVKRSTNWGVMRGTWGKRGDWNSARGMWGKRSEPAYFDDSLENGNEEKRTWHRASGMWGKRSPYLDDDHDSLEYGKRGWEKAAGMWGKRTGWNTAKGMWGRRKREATFKE